MFQKASKFFLLGLVFGSLGIGFLTMGVSEAQTDPLLDRRLEVVLLDCGENANTFVVENISSTLNVGINQGLDCAAAVQKLLASGFVLGSGSGGATSGESVSLDHFLMIFVLNRNDLIEQRSATTLLNPGRDCVLEQNLRECPPTLQRNETLSPTLNRPVPGTPILPRHEPLTPILQSREPLSRPGR